MYVYTWLIISTSCQGWKEAATRHTLAYHTYTHPHTGIDGRCELVWLWCELVWLWIAGNNIGSFDSCIQPLVYARCEITTALDHAQPFVAAVYQVYVGIIFQHKELAACSRKRSYCQLHIITHAARCISSNVSSTLPSSYYRLRVVSYHVYNISLCVYRLHVAYRAYS